MSSLVNSGASLKTPNRSNTMRTRAIVASSIGNFFELFDFVLYGFLAAIIGRLFFPAIDPMTSLLSSFATYGVGSECVQSAPWSSVLMGIDTEGKLVDFTIAVMALSTIGVGLLPTYTQIGRLAAVLLLICRLAQGFSTGGELAARPRSWLNMPPAALADGREAGNSSARSPVCLRDRSPLLS